MPNMTLSIPEELHALMKRHPEISWSAVARRAIEEYATKLAWFDDMLKDSKLTEQDVEELDRMIKKGIAERLRQAGFGSSSTPTS